MAHSNIDARRDYVNRLIKKGKPKRDILASATIKFNCAKGAIYSDMLYLSNLHLPNGCQIASKMKRFVLERDNYICQYCNTKPEYIVVEHIIPTYHKGETIPENLVAACVSCNALKRRNIWIPRNFMEITKENLEHREYVLSNAVKDFR